VISAVSIVDVVKNFGSLQALAGVSIEIEQGEFFGLLGPNGAGKTTLISSLAGLIRPDSGVLKVLGHDVIRDFREARRCLVWSRKNWFSIHSSMYVKPYVFSPAILAFVIMMHGLMKSSKTLI
jgi:ABC-type multidrug transport system ATPase subunit